MQDALLFLIFPLSMGDLLTLRADGLCDCAPSPAFSLPRHFSPYLLGPPAPSIRSGVCLPSTGDRTARPSPFGGAGTSWAAVYLVRAGPFVHDADGRCRAAG